MVAVCGLLNDILDLSLEYLLSHTFLCLVFLVNFRKCSNISILDLGRKKIKDICCCIQAMLGGRESHCQVGPKPSRIVG